MRQIACSWNAEVISKSFQSLAQVELSIRFFHFILIEEGKVYLLHTPVLLWNLLFPNFQIRLPVTNDTNQLDKTISQSKRRISILWKKYSIRRVEVEVIGRQELKNAILRKFWVLQYFFSWRFFAFITVFTFLVKDCVASLLQAPGNTVLNYDKPAGRLSLWDDLKPEGVFQGVTFGANEFSCFSYWVNEQ